MYIHMCIYIYMCARMDTRATKRPTHPTRTFVFRHWTHIHVGSRSRLGSNRALAAITQQQASLQLLWLWQCRHLSARGAANWSVKSPSPGAGIVAQRPHGITGVAALRSRISNSLRAWQCRHLRARCAAKWSGKSPSPCAGIVAQSPHGITGVAARESRISKIVRRKFHALMLLVHPDKAGDVANGLARQVNEDKEVLDKFFSWL